MSELNAKSQPKMSFKQAEMIRAAARKNVVRCQEMRAGAETKKRERDSHRLLKAAGYNLKKTPARHWSRESYGVGYMVIDDRNVVVCGATQHEYDATLLDVACFMESIDIKLGI